MQELMLSAGCLLLNKVMFYESCLKSAPSAANPRTMSQLHHSCF